MADDDETLRMLKDAAAGLAKPDGARIRALRGKTPPFDRQLWAQMAQQGWLSILVPEVNGGLGLGVAAAAVVAERLGYAAACEPFVASGVLVPLILATCEPGPRRDELLARVIDGSTIASAAWQSEAGELDPGRASIAALEETGGFVLTGSVRYVPVPSADRFIVYARTSLGAALFDVDRAATGLTLTAERSPDGAGTGWLLLDGVRLEPAFRLAGEPTSTAILGSALDTARIVVSAELVGIMERALEMTLDYMRTRKQFGQPIGAFQALQHSAVDLWTQKELARHATNAAARAADAADATDSVRASAASSAKFRASEAAMLLGKQCIQLHGAIGFTDEYDLGLYVNRILALQAWLGNASEHCSRYSALARGTGEAA